MDPEISTEVARQDTTFTLDDVAFLSDGSGDLPADTASRLRTIICCGDLELVRRTWLRIEVQLHELRQMAADAGVEEMADGLYVSRTFEQLRSQPWERPEDVLHSLVEVPYQALITMAHARAERAGSAEQARLRRLSARLVVGFGIAIAATSTAPRSAG